MLRLLEQGKQEDYIAPVELVQRASLQRPGTRAARAHLPR
jgi:hypothetical protein